MKKKMNVKSLFIKPEKFTNYESISLAMRSARKWSRKHYEAGESV